MRSPDEIRDRIADLEATYDEQDPPTTPMEDSLEVTVLRAIEELEWVLEERDETDGFTE